MSVRASETCTKMHWTACVVVDIVLLNSLWGCLKFLFLFLDLGRRSHFRHLLSSCHHARLVLRPDRFRNMGSRNAVANRTCSRIAFMFQKNMHELRKHGCQQQFTYTSLNHTVQGKFENFHNFRTLEIMTPSSALFAWIILRGRSMASISNSDRQISK